MMTKMSKYVVLNEEKYIGKNVKNVVCRSRWEERFCSMCDNHPNVVKWASESISIKYMHPLDNVIRTYIPDFYVVYQDAKGKVHAEIVEVKPYNQTNPKYAKSYKDQEAVVINMAKWKAANAFCKKHGIKFRIINEQNIYKNTRYSKNVKKRVATRKRK